jgi:hypothetical protein
MTKAICPGEAFWGAAALASLVVLFAAGCGNFWENPAGSTSTGTTTSSISLSPASTSVTTGTTDVLTATVTPTAATGTVNFLNGGSSIGTGTLSSGAATYTATFTITGTTAVTETLTADYEGNSTYASSVSSAVTVTVNPTSSGSSQPGVFNQATASRATNLVLDSASIWSLTASTHLHNVAVVMLNGSTVQNIDGDGHCVFYSGTVYFAKSSQTSPNSSDSKGVYELSGGGYLAPEGTTDLDCE